MPVCVTNLCDIESYVQRKGKGFEDFESFFTQSLLVVNPRQKGQQRAKESQKRTLNGISKKWRICDEVFNWKGQIFLLCVENEFKNKKRLE